MNTQGTYVHMRRWNMVSIWALFYRVRNEYGIKLGQDLWAVDRLGFTRIFNRQLISSLDKRTIIWYWRSKLCVCGFRVSYTDHPILSHPYAMEIIMFLFYMIWLDQIRSLSCCLYFRDQKLFSHRSYSHFDCGPLYESLSSFKPPR